LLLGLAACSGSPPGSAEAPAAQFSPEQGGAGPVRRFFYVALDGSEVSTASLRGRMSVLALVATYDDLCQVQAAIVNALLRRHSPRINAAALVLEPPHHRPMAEAFAAVLELSYPVALVDEATIAGEGPFPALHHVPSVVVLDRQGREVWRKLGLAEEEEIAEVLRRWEDNR